MLKSAWKSSNGVHFVHTPIRRRLDGAAMQASLYASNASLTCLVLIHPLIRHALLAPCTWIPFSGNISIGCIRLPVQLKGAFTRG